MGSEKNLTRKFGLTSDPTNDSIATLDLGSARLVIKDKKTLFTSQENNSLNG